MYTFRQGSWCLQWIGPSTALYFLHALVVDATNEPSGEIARLLRSFTFTVFPTINPDGYAYSHKHNRMWRKNRQQLGSELCSGLSYCFNWLGPVESDGSNFRAGIDLNSNWGYKWRPGRSTSTCSDSYSGQMAFEAYETRVMANYLANGTSWCPGCGRAQVDGDEGKGPRRRVRAFVDLHSYGQLCKCFHRAR